MIGHLLVHLVMKCPGCGGSLDVNVDLEKHPDEAKNWQVGFVQGHAECAVRAEKPIVTSDTEH